MAQRRGKERGLADPPDDEDSRPFEEETAGPIPEMMRRALTLGLAGFFTTEGAVRRALGDTVPKDWTDFLAETSERTRSEFLERLSGEIGRVLEGVDIGAVIKGLMVGRTLEVKAEFRLLDEPGGSGNGSPSIRFSATGTGEKKSDPAADNPAADNDDDEAVEEEGI